MLKDKEDDDNMVGWVLRNFKIIVLAETILLVDPEATTEGLAEWFRQRMLMLKIL